MKEICLCIQIHIPAIHSNYRFFNINNHHSYFDDVQLRNHVSEVYYHNVQPFLETLLNITADSGKRIKAGISVSGITLSLFKRFIPEAIERLITLKERNLIEFLSQTWSNSVLAFSDSLLMIRQINLHDKMMKSVFGSVSNVFIAHSPIARPELFTTVFGCGKKQIFTYSNHIGSKIATHENSFRVGFSDDYQVYLINYKAGQNLLELSHNSEIKPVEDFALSIVRKIKRNTSGFNPQVIVYNPCEFKRPFLTRDSIYWNRIVANLLGDPQIRFLFPSEMKNCQNQSPVFSSLPGKWLNKCKLPDYWLKNSLQKDAFGCQREINQRVPFFKTESLLKEWDVLHDRDYLFYMDTHFSESKFIKTYFNPYQDPYMAYMNYMNILDGFKERIHYQKKKITDKINLTDQYKIR